MQSSPARSGPGESQTAHLPDRYNTAPINHRTNDNLSEAKTRDIHPCMHHCKVRRNKLEPHLPLTQELELEAHGGEESARGHFL